MKLLGGYKQTVDQSWKPTKRPRHNAEALICAITQAVRDPDLLEKGLHTLITNTENTPEFKYEMRKIFNAALKNGRIDPTKHTESYGILSKYYKIVFGDELKITYEMD